MNTVIITETVLFCLTLKNIENSFNKIIETEIFNNIVDDITIIYVMQILLFA